MGAATPNLISAAASAGSAVSSANATRAQGRYQAQVAMINGQMASQRADQASAKGDQTAESIRRKAVQIQGEERLQAAAGGASPDTGDSLDLQTETALASRQDIQTAKTNAWQEAFGFGTESRNSVLSGKFAQMTADNQARNTILTGGMTALSDLTKASIKTWPKGGRGTTTTNSTDDNLWGTG